MNDNERAYPPEAWIIRESAFDPRLTARNETIFALGNGHIGLRGNFEEGRCNAVDGTYINGFYEETPIVYGETAHGYAKNRQVMLNVADGKIIRLFVDGEPFDLSAGKIEGYQRWLDLRTGILERTVRWRSPAGAVLDLRFRRIVPLERRHLAAIELEAAVAGGGARLTAESAINGRVRNMSSRDDPRIGTSLPESSLTTVHTEAEGRWGAVVQETRNTGFAVACAMDHDAEAIQSEASAGPDSAAIVFTDANGREGGIRFTKYLAYCTSLDFPREELLERARQTLREAKAAGFESLASEQREALRRFWLASDVEVHGDDALQQGLRYNLFCLLGSAGRDGRTSIPAKGLTGEGYEGHYFWDAEIYVLPFFIYTHPDIARSLLRFRLGTLDKARARAAEMSQTGALFPWRTIGGEETSPYFPAGSAQYHIDADIAYALQKYLNASGDKTLLLEGGAETVFETARMWAGLGDYIPEKGGDFCINGVTGPDEYTVLVNNDLFTNVMARNNLEYAAALARELRESFPEDFARISHSIRLDGAEIEEWRRAAARMRVPYDRDKGIHAQDDLFLSRAVWNFEGTPAGNYPLLLHYHPLVIYRYQVLKQPDVVLAQVLLSDRFSMAEKKRNFDYYDPLTTGDSSLSACIQCVAAAELGYMDKAYRYFMRTARIDLDDAGGNTAAGIHAAAAAGTWFAVVYGFAGMRDREGRLSFKPRLPPQWDLLRFRLRFRGRLLEVEVNREAATYRLLQGDPLSIHHGRRRLKLSEKQPVTARLSPRPS